MKEEDAKTKLCPHLYMAKEIRILSSVAVFTTNKTQSIADKIEEITENDAHKCIASDCMMWVPDRQYKNVRMVGFGVLAKDVDESVNEGHCGLVNN